MVSPHPWHLEVSFFLAWSGHNQQLSVLVWLFCLVMLTQGAFPEAAPETFALSWHGTKVWDCLGNSLPCPTEHRIHPWGRNPLVPTLAGVSTTPKGSLCSSGPVPVIPLSSKLNFPPPQKKKNTNTTDEERSQHQQAAWISSLQEQEQGHVPTWELLLAFPLSGVAQVTLLSFSER